MNPENALPQLERTRRHFFADCGVGLGKMALAGLLADHATRRPLVAAAPGAAGFDPLAVRPPHICLGVPHFCIQVNVLLSAELLKGNFGACIKLEGKPTFFRNLFSADLIAQKWQQVPNVVSGAGGLLTS